MTEKEVKIKIPQTVKKTAIKAFQLKEIGYEGATETGWKRASQLVNDDFIPIQDLRTMRNWYARHIFTSYPGYKKWVDEGRKFTRSHAPISWLTWGGDAGFKWVNSTKVLNILNKYFNKDYDLITL